MIDLDNSLLARFQRNEVRIGDLDWGGRYTRTCGRYTRTFGTPTTTNAYWLRNRHALPSRRDILSVHGGIRESDQLGLGYAADYFGTEVKPTSDGHPRYCLITALSGALELAGPNGEVEAQGSKGMILRALPDTRLATTDGSVRLVIWMAAGRLERTLQAQIGEPPREMLMFAPGADWSSRQGRIVWRMTTRLLEESRDPDGLTSEPVARELFTDLFLQTVLSRLQHNYTARLERPSGTAIPRHLRRAEAFMHASADQPITIVDIAAAAGCGTATLYAAFRQFRDTTPLTTLHGIRLQRVREALRESGDEVSSRTIARRFGFTNPSRFLVAYRKQFREHPNETKRRG